MSPPGHSEGSDLHRKVQGVMLEHCAGHCQELVPCASVTAGGCEADVSSLTATTSKKDFVFILLVASSRR